jgi:tetratricopeptide (TPR) repeat protein
MEGLEVYRRLRGDGEEDPEAVIVAYGWIPKATTVLRLGMVDVLARPLTPAAIRAAVEEILRVAAGLRPDPARPRILVAVEPMVLELLRAKQALDRREFEDAERLLRRVIGRDPDSAVAHNLMGVLHQRLGEHHAAFHAFQAALRADPHYELALENLKRHCNRFGLDFPKFSCRRADRDDPPSPVGHSKDDHGPSGTIPTCDRSPGYLGQGSSFPTR